MLKECLGFMSLHTGDIFEGIYQLEESVLAGGPGEPSRWRADDITAYRRSEVIIDTLPGEYTPDLHWKADMPGIKRAGQSESSQCRYIVWPQEQVLPPILRYELSQPDDYTRKRLARLIDTLPVAADETLLAQASPEYWHYGAEGVMIFYRKALTSQLASQSERDVKEYWKGTLLGETKNSSLPVDIEVPKPKSSVYWPLALGFIGILLAVGVYILRSQPDKRLKSQSANRLTAFSEVLARGIAYAEKAAYPEALESFEMAVNQAPASERIDARLDSLARAYTAYAKVECARYRSTGSTQLYFIPDQYFHYAAILGRHPTIETCK